MRKIIPFMILLLTLGSIAQNAPIDFEAGGEGASWTWTVFENDDNPPLEIVANPDPSGENTSATVAKFTARDLGQPFAGVESMHGSDIGTFDLTAANAYVSIKVYKTKISDVGIKFATPPGGAQPELKVANSTVNQWETITIDFTSYIGLPETTGLDQIIIFPDFIDRTADDIIYFDDITFSDTPPAGGVQLPVTFEDPALNYVFEGFEGADSNIEANAVSGGINTSATVMRSTKTVGAQFFAGTALNLDVPINTGVSEVITIKTYSPKANIPVRMALENQTTGNQIVVDANTTVQNEWEVLTFNFSGLTDPAINYNKVVVFFEFIVGLAGDGSTYYFDDIDQLVTTPVELPVTFEDPTALYDFVGFEGADSNIEANAVSGGINTSATVMRTTKTVGAQFFAGTALNLDVPINFSTPAEISIKSYSPKANIPVRLALENQTTGNQVFVDMNTTVQDEWEVLTFDFTGIIDPAIEYNKVVVFYEFVVGLAGDGSTYYFDDIEVFVPTPVELPVTFEDPTAIYTVAGFEGADVAVEANSVSGGINTSPTVLRSTKTAGAEFFAGASLELDVPIDFSTSEFLQIKTYSPKANIPVRMRLENAANTVGIELDVNTTVADEWEILTYNFSDLTAGVNWVRVKIYFEYTPGLMGDGSTYYYDDLEIATPVFTPVALPVTFEDATANYQFIGFEGADSAIEANAVSGGINTSATAMRSTKTVGAQFFAGTALELDEPIDFSSSELIAMKTYSPKAGIPVKLRLENADNSVGIEVDVNTTVVDEWEILTYDFTGQTAGTDFVRVVVFFEFIDGLPGDGSTYYFDDIENAEPVLEVSDFDAASVTLYPNPVSTTLNIMSTNEISRIDIIAITGQVIKSTYPQASTSQISMDMLDTGVYFVNISATDGAVITKRIIKN
jgi:Secretion system C-terminal sorting domain